jgi:hypothetical protein
MKNSSQVEPKPSAPIEPPSMPEKPTTEKPM